MTTPKLSVERISLNRITDTGTDAPAGTFGDTFYGFVTNVSGGNKEYIGGTSQGPAGEVMRSTRKFRHTPLTFDSVSWSESGVTLADENVIINRFVTLRNEKNLTETDAREVRVVQYHGWLTIPEGDFTYDDTSDSDIPVSYTLNVTRKIVGGGSDHNTLTKTGAASYSDSETGEDYVGGVDRQAAIRTAHGLSA